MSNAKYADTVGIHWQYVLVVQNVLLDVLGTQNDSPTPRRGVHPVTFGWMRQPTLEPKKGGTTTATAFRQDTGRELESLAAGGWGALDNV